MALEDEIYVPVPLVKSRHNLPHNSRWAAEGVLHEVLGKYGRARLSEACGPHTDVRRLFYQLLHELPQQATPACRRWNNLDVMFMTQAIA